MRCNANPQANAAAHGRTSSRYSIILSSAKNAKTKMAAKITLSKVSVRF